MNLHVEAVWAGTGSPLRTHSKMNHCPRLPHYKCERCGVLWIFNQKQAQCGGGRWCALRESTLWLGRA